MFIEVSAILAFLWLALLASYLHPIRAIARARKGK